MSLSKRLAAWHEAGHAIRAFFCRKRSISHGTISLEAFDGGRWEGTTGVDMEIIPSSRRVDVCLAGLMAEARLNGIEHAAAAGQADLLEEQPDLAATLAGYYALPDNDETAQTMEHTAVRVCRADGHVIVVNAATNFADLNEVPDPYRTAERLSEAITRLADFFNNEEPWFRVRLLAEDLDEQHWPVLYDYLSFLRATMLPP